MKRIRCLPSAVERMQEEGGKEAYETRGREKNVLPSVSVFALTESARGGLKRGGREFASFLSLSEKPKREQAALKSVLLQLRFPISAAALSRDPRCGLP